MTEPLNAAALAYWRQQSDERVRDPDTVDWPDREVMSLVRRFLATIHATQSAPAPDDAAALAAALDAILADQRNVYVNSLDTADIAEQLLAALPVHPPAPPSEVTLTPVYPGDPGHGEPVWIEAAPPAPLPLDALNLLGYLWDATGKNPAIRVRDLFDENDPLVADVERMLARATPEPIEDGG